MDKKLLEFVKEFVTENRLNLFNKVLNDRTNYITVALEDIFQPHNASAVLRTCDCFGVQDIHIIENRNEYNVNPDVVVGSSKWLNLYKYNQKKNNTLDTINSLKQKGYRIVATTPHTHDVDLHKFDITKGKFALFFGTEYDGISQIVVDNADEYLKIPMYGFTESYNISVSAALIMQELTYKLRNSELDWHLSPNEKDEILLEWILKTIKKPEELVKRFKIDNHQS